MRGCYVLRDILNPLLHDLERLLVIAADRACHLTIVREHIKYTTSLDRADREDYVLLVVDAPRLDRIQGLVDGSSGVDRVTELMRCAAVAALPDNADLDCCHFGKEAARANPNVAFVKLGHVVESVDLIDAVEASFLNHRLSATRALLCRLIKDAYSLVGRELFFLCDQHLNYAGDRGHMAVVAAHMCELSLRFILEIRVIL